MPLKIFIIFLFCLFFNNLNAEENLKNLGKFKDWETYFLMKNEKSIF